MHGVTLFELIDHDTQLTACECFIWSINTEIGNSATVTLQGENSVCDATIKQESHTSDRVQYMKPLSSDRENNVVSSHNSSPDRLLVNPIYGCSEEETENIYAYPDTNYQSATGSGMESVPQYHQFNNPIYGLEEDKSPYSMMATSTAKGTAPFKSGDHPINIETEQVYDYIKQK